MNIARRQVFSLTIACLTPMVAAAWVWVDRPANAQADFPNRPIAMIVPGVAGASTDVVGRVLAERMKRSLGQPIIIEDIGGADGSIGAGRAARARPDGYTIELGYLGSNVLNGGFYSLPYDVLNDFAPVSPLVSFPQILLARKTMPAKNVSELIAWLKANPYKASVGVTAVGQRLIAASFQKQAGVHFTLVPYRGLAPARQDLMAGQIDLLFDVPDSLPLIRGGSVRAYAVTGEDRLAAAPDIPTLAEMGLPAASWTAWYAFFAPRGTKSDIIGKLNAATAEALADSTVQSRLLDLGFAIFPRQQQTPNALGALVKAGAEKWWPVIKELGLKADAEMGQADAVGQHKGISQ
jgi:tripartite-type tricarboxylate transporter receptor subunit TctC